jgi:hypothetical protein
VNLSDTDDDDDDLPRSESPKDKTFNQYVVLPGNAFKPVTEAVAGLPSGFYQVKSTYDGPTFTTLKMTTDHLIDIPGTVIDTVFQDMMGFLKSSEEYKQLGLTHKRGYLFTGAPGSGKSATVVLLGRRLIKEGGVVIIPSSADLFLEAVKILRNTEKGRSVMYVLQELPDLLAKEEHKILAVLDGEESVNHSVFVATTNHPHKLSARLKERPSRFDLILEVNNPSTDVRVAYALQILKRSNRVKDPNKTAQDIAEVTNGLSLAHVKEAIILTQIFHQDLKTVRDRFTPHGKESAHGTAKEDDAD